MGIKEVSRELCIGCGDCVENCPMDVLRMTQASLAYIAYPGDCMDCYTCQESCPVDAIEIVPESTRKLWFSYEIVDKS